MKLCKRVHPSRLLLSTSWTPDPSAGDCKITSYMDPDPSGHAWGWIWGITLFGKCLAGMPWFSDLANFVNTIGQVLMQFSNFLCSTAYSLLFISRTQMVVGLCGILSSSTPTAAFHCSRHFRARFFTRPYGSEVQRRLWSFSSLLQRWPLLKLNSPYEEDSDLSLPLLQRCMWRR